MTMAAISLLSMPKTVTADGPGAGAPDAPAGFAAMMAGAAYPAKSQGPAIPDAKGGKDASPPGDAKNTKGPTLASDAGDADADQDGLDDVRDTNKDRHDKLAQDDGATSTMALLGLAVPPVVRNDDHGETVGGEQPAPNLAVAAQSQRDAAPAGDGKADAPADTDADAATLAPVLAALTDTLARGAAARRAETTAPATDKAGLPVPSRGADAPQAAPANAAAAASIGKPEMAPRASATMDVAPPAAPPLPATATLMAARAATTVSPDLAKNEARKPAGISHAASEREEDADAPVDAASATSATPAPVATLLTATGDRTAPASAPAIDGAGQQLAAATTDRQLDLARQGAWLDGISHDIAAAGASSGTVRFEVAPQHLGTVSVELRRDDGGAAVTLTTGSEAARSILTDATPQLLAEARAHGLHIASAQVDVGTGNAGSGGNPSADSQGRPSGGQPDGRHAASQDTGFSTQTGTGGEAGRQSQTRSQPLPEYRSGSARTDRGPAGEAKAPAAASSARSPDARYA